MVSEIEKQFFDTFGIKKKELEYPDNFTYYPEITDHILLELICIIGSIYICAQDIETIKEHILIQCMNIQMNEMDIKQQVRTLFEGG